MIGKVNAYSRNFVHIVNERASLHCTCTRAQFKVKAGCMYVCMRVNIYLNTENHQLSLS